MRGGRRKKTSSSALQTYEALLLSSEFLCSFISKHPHISLFISPLTHCSTGWMLLHFPNIGASQIFHRERTMLNKCLNLGGPKRSRAGVDSRTQGRGQPFPNDCSEGSHTREPFGAPLRGHRGLLPFVGTLRTMVSDPGKCDA